MNTLWQRLRGGDLRSIGAADQVAREALADAGMVPDLIAGLGAPDPVVRMRCADALEKATRVRPEYLQPYAKHLLALIEATQPKELLWHVLQMAPRVQWPATNHAALFRAVERCFDQTSSIVKVCAMQALADLARQAPRRRARVEALLREHAASGTPAMRARGAKLLRRLY